jgi:SAM-dependent methyltransferase
MRERAPENWFEDIYASSDTTGRGVPWARQEPSPLLVRWLDEHRRQGHGARAMVVGCGLGDDAIELAARGFAVTAFDVADSAIALCRERWPTAAVDWQVRELFDLPAAWRQAFDLVVEHRTIQSLPPDWQARGMAAIADLVGPGATLLVIADLRPAGTLPEGPPWRLRPEELRALAGAGLAPVDQQILPVPHDRDRERLVASYVRST